MIRIRGKCRVRRTSFDWIDGGPRSESVGPVDFFAGYLPVGLAYDFVDSTTV